jgi:hypothetical protein
VLVAPLKSLDIIYVQRKKGQRPLDEVAIVLLVIITARISEPSSECLTATPMPVYVDVFAIPPFRICDDVDDTPNDNQHRPVHWILVGHCCNSDEMMME